MVADYVLSTFKLSERKLIEEHEDFIFQLIKKRILLQIWKPNLAKPDFTEESLLIKPYSSAHMLDWFFALDIFSLEKPALPLPSPFMIFEAEMRRLIMQYMKSVLNFFTMILFRMLSWNQIRGILYSSAAEIFSEDPDNWTNHSLATYYGKESVVVSSVP